MCAYTLVDRCGVAKVMAKDNGIEWCNPENNEADQANTMHQRGRAFKLSGWKRARYALGFVKIWLRNYLMSNIFKLGGNFLQ